MIPRPILAACALTLALAACGKPEAPAEQVAEPAISTVAPPAQAEAPAPASASGAAIVADCATTLEGNDAMQYNASSIAVPKDCTQFTIRLDHVGRMPIAAMGHDVVVSSEADMPGILADGMAVAPDHLKPGDARVIAATRMIGGGETASVTFDTAKIATSGPFVFFCSFPGHSALMKGTISVQ